MANSIEGSVFPVPLTGNDMNLIFQKLKTHDCSICLEPFFEEGIIDANLYQKECGHVFHDICAFDAHIDHSMRLDEKSKIWKSSKPCPICKRDIGTIFDSSLFIHKSSRCGDLVMINCKSPRIRKYAHIFVDETVSMMEVLRIYLKINGDSESRINNYPQAYLVWYEGDVKFCPRNLGDNIVTLRDFSIKNGMKIDLYLLYN